MNEGKIEYLVNDAHGQYVPQVFVELYSAEKWHVSDEDAELLLAGPYGNWYWETWEDVLNTAYYMDDLGHKWTLYPMDGGLFSVRDDYEHEEY